MKIIVENARQAKELTRRNGDTETRDLQDFLDLCLSEITKEANKGTDYVYIYSFGIDDIRPAMNELEELGFTVLNKDDCLEISW